MQHFEFGDLRQSSSSVMGMSDAPKSTVPSVSWRIPPPEPMAW
jgi:hypothetical protein